MVGTIAVLSGGASGAAQYFTATAGYYDTQQSGIWHGSACQRLHLYGGVMRVDFELLLAGFSPAGGRLTKAPRRSRDQDDAGAADRKRRSASNQKPATKNRKPKRAERVPGYDMTFSVPKSVSLMHALGSQQSRIGIETATRSAVRDTVDDLETMHPLGRRGLNGMEHIAAQLATAMFLHTTSRDNDPQLHVHCVIANVGYGEDGRWSAINSRMLHDWTPAMGRIFRCHLARYLSQDLGLELERPVGKDGELESWFEVKGVPKEVVREFSQRRAAIEAETPKDQLHDAKERSKANLQTRRKKDPEMTQEKLREQWKVRAANYGFTSQSVDKLIGQSKELRPLSKFELAKTVHDSLDALGKEKAHFRQWELVSEVCERVQHRGVVPAKFLADVSKYLENSRSVVVLDPKRSQEQYSTRQNWNLEKKLLGDVERLSETGGAVVTPRIVEKTCRQFAEDPKRPFSNEQRMAVESLLKDEKSIRVLTGVAGAGKSVTLDAVRIAFERQGYKVLGGALAGTAASGLTEKAGIQSRTVASYVHHLDRSTTGKLADRVKYDARMMGRALRGKPTYKYERVKIPRNSVLVVDEAGMLDTRSMSRLVHHIKKAGATLVLVGDSQQLPPIEAGGPLQRICEKLGHTELTTNYRQQDEADRIAVSLLRSGKTLEALDNYKSRGRLTITEGPEDTLNSVVSTWKEQGGCKDPKSHIILTQTRADARELNQRCQRELQKSKWKPGLGVRHGETIYYSGDRVMFHLPMRRLGIENGFSGTVTKVDLLRQRITVKLDREPSRQGRNSGQLQSQSRLVTIPLLHTDSEAISLGYAATTHKYQGETVDHALVLAGGKMLSKQLAYTQLTRASLSTRIFASRDQAGENLEKLAAGMQRSALKNLAHDEKSERSPVETKRAEKPISKPNRRNQRPDINNEY